MTKLLIPLTSFSCFIICRILYNFIYWNEFYYSLIGRNLRININHRVCDILNKLRQAEPWPALVEARNIKRGNVASEAYTFKPDRRLLYIIIYFTVLGVLREL